MTPRRGDCGTCDLTVTLRMDGTIRRHKDPTGRDWVCPGAGEPPKPGSSRAWAPAVPASGEPPTARVGVPTEPIVTADGRLWVMPGDIAHLTFLREETGETEEIRALAIKPRGAGAGWVLSDGTRIPLRPRTVIKIAIVFPEEHRATEHVTHPDPEPEEHTTPEDDPHDHHTH